MAELSGRAILVTGATGNLGRAVVSAAARHGARVALVDRSEEKLREAYLASGDGLLLLGGVDFKDPASLDRAVGAAVGRFGRLDGIVATAGGFKFGPPVAEDDWASWEQMLDANLRSAVAICRAAVPRLTAPGGRIVTVGSKPGLAGAANIAAYSAAKSAVIRLTESLAAELKDRGINVNCILPSIIDTPENRAAMPKADFSRWVEPAALADVILFLLSDASRAVTGAAIPVYGRS